MDAKISPSFWNDDSLATASLRLASLWLRTNAHVTNAGYGEYSLRRFVFETGLPSEALAECFAALGSRCRHDDKAYWLRDFIGENFGRGESLARNNFARSVPRAIEAARCPWLAAAVYEEYPEIAPSSYGVKEALPRGLASGPTTGIDREDREEGEERIGSGVQGGRKGAASRPADVAEAIAYAAELGLSATQAEAFYDHFEANGWRQGGRTPLRSWQAALRNWQRRAGSFGKNSSEGGAPARPPLFDPANPPPGYIA